MSCSHFFGSFGDFFFSNHWIKNFKFFGIWHTEFFSNDSVINITSTLTIVFDTLFLEIFL